MFDKDLIVEMFDDLLGLLPSAQGNNNSAAYNHSWWLIVHGTVHTFTCWHIRLCKSLLRIAIYVVAVVIIND